MTEGYPFQNAEHDASISVSLAEREFDGLVRVSVDAGSSMWAVLDLHAEDAWRFGLAVVEAARKASPELIGALLDGERGPGASRDPGDVDGPEKAVQRVILCGNTCGHDHESLNGPTGCCPEHGPFMYFCGECHDNPLQRAHNHSREGA